MALDVIVTTNRITKDPNGRDLISYFRDHTAELELETAVLYYDFPTYSDYETVSHKPDAMLVSSRHGVVAIRFIDAQEDPATIQSIDESLSQFCSILIGRLLRSPSLRRNLSNLKFDVSPILVIAKVGQQKAEPANCPVVNSFEGLKNELAVLNNAHLDSAALA